MPHKPNDEARLYVSIEGRAGQLVVDGPLSLLADLLASVRAEAPPHRPLPAADTREEADRHALTASR